MSMKRNWKKNGGLSKSVSADLRDAIMVGQILHSSLAYGFNETSVKCLKELRGKNELYLMAVARTVSKRMRDKDDNFISLT